MYTVTVRAAFSAAHRLREYKGKCEALHGHNWAVEMTAGVRQLDKTGMVVDFSILKKGLMGFVEKLDHKLINELEPFTEINPTSENIARFIYEGMEEFCRREGTELIKVTVWETAGSSATYEA